MDEQIIITTQNTAAVSYVHSLEQTSLRQCSTQYTNSSCLVGDKFLFIAQAKKALINVYNLSGAHKRESVEQRIPLPEVITCLEVVENNVANYRDTSDNEEHKIPSFNLPYLLLGSTPSGKLYVWELNSGNLLAVKPMAHYQSITKIKSAIQGKYVITSGADSRLIIWQTMDLVNSEKEEPKPLYILHDHTLPITDFYISNAHTTSLASNVKLFTVSQDMTLRCYDLNANYKQPKLLTIFTFTSALTSITLDPADRCCYVGTETSSYSVQFYYKLSGNKLVNLLQLGENKIFSCVEPTVGQNRDELYSMGQLVCEKITSNNVTKLEVSLDGSLLIIGDSSGKCSICDVYSKQAIKEIEPMTSQGTAGEVTNIILSPLGSKKHENLLNGTALSQQNASNQKIPTLQRSVFNKDGLHDITYQIGEPRDTDDYFFNPVEDFDSYLDNVASQENVFMQLGGVVTTAKIVGNQESEIHKSTETNKGEKASAKDQEITELKKTVETLTGAYKELREMHEKLFEEHEKLLEEKQ